MSKSKYLLSAVLLLIPVLLGVRYLVSRNFQPETKISQLPLVMVNYFFPDGQLTNDEKNSKLKIDNFNLVTAVISKNWPNLKEAAVVTNINFSNISEYNLTVASNHDDFVAQANLRSKSISDQSLVTSLLENESYQKYIQIVPSRHYNIYLNLEHSSDIEPQAVIINDRSYPITKTETSYQVTGFYSSEAVAIGLKSVDSGVTIKQAVAATGQITSRTYNPKRLSAKEAELKANVDGSKLKVASLEDNRYLLAEVLSDYHVTKVGLSQQVGQIPYFSYKAAGNDFAQIGLQQNRKLFFLDEGGDYRISNLRHQNQARRVAEVSIISSLMIFLILFYRRITDYLGKQITFFRNKVYRPSVVYANNHLIDLIILTLSVNALVVLRGNPQVGSYLTPTNIFIIFIFGLILVARLSPKVIVSVMVAFLSISALLAQAQLTAFMNKTALYVYLLLVLLIILLAATRGKKNQED